ncbi:MAG: hypothetical protein WC785_04445 [Tatlockia sp.]|jgi:hypothetical protein
MPKITIFQQENQLISDQLANIEYRLDKEQAICLVLPDKLSPDQLQYLGQWLQKTPPNSVYKLSLFMDTALLQTPECHFFLQCLNEIAIESIELLLNKEDLNTPGLDTLLAEHIAKGVDFPVLIMESGREDVSMQFPTFIATIIQSIQQARPKQARDEANFEFLEGIDGAPIKLKSLIHHADANQFNHYVQIDVQHMEVVEQQVQEMVEVSVVVEQEVAQYHGECIDYAAFKKKYSESAHLSSPFRPSQVADAIALAEYELFANLPHAIKYLSPNAEEKLASALPQWVALNKENCAPFELSKTPQGEYVLDYDPLTEQPSERKPFALDTYIPYRDSTPFYSLFDAVKPLLGTIPQASIRLRIIQGNCTSLMNLWLTQGDTGVTRFFQALTELDLVHSGLAEFLDDAYFSHFDHLTPFYRDDFFDMLGSLRAFTPVHIACLKKFLVHTGASRHNLINTVNDFSYFWKKCEELCQGSNPLLSQIAGQWETPQGGQPGTYMQRLLTLLTNARDLPDQLSALAPRKFGSPEQNAKALMLDAFGAYYASKYEGFTCVASCMDFVYNPVALHAKPFHSGFQCYRTSLDTLYNMVTVQGAYIILNESELIACKLENGLYRTWAIDSTKETLSTGSFESLQKEGKAIAYVDYVVTGDILPPAFKLYIVYDYGQGSAFQRIHPSLPISPQNYYRHVYRFMGQQLAGMPTQMFINTFQKVLSYGRKYSYPEHENECNFSMQLRLMECLYYITGARFKGVLNANKKFCGKSVSTFEWIFKNAESICIKEMLDKLACLKQLHEQQVNFNDLEAEYYIAIQDFYSIERKHDGDIYAFMVFQDYPRLLNRQLMANRYATLQFIRVIGAQKTIRGTSYALYSLEYLSRGANVGNALQDDLLLFSALLANYQFNLLEEDFKALPKEHADLQKLNEIRRFLEKASHGETQQNTALYVFQCIVSSEQFLTYDTALTLFREAEALAMQNGVIDHKAIHTLFQKEGITVKLYAPEIVCRDNQEIRSNLIQIIEVLSRANAYGKPMKFLVDMGKAAASTNEDTKAGFIKKYNTESVRARMAQLKDTDIATLQIHLNEAMQACGKVASLIAGGLIKNLLNNLKTRVVYDLFKLDSYSSKIALTLKELLTPIKPEPKLPFALYNATLQLPEVEEADDFKQLTRITSLLTPLAIACIALCKQAGVQGDFEAAYLKCIETIDFKRCDIDSFTAFMTLFSSMPHRDHQPIFAAFTGYLTKNYEKATCYRLIELVQLMDNQQFSTPMIVDFCRLFNNEDLDYVTFIRELGKIHAQDDQDKLLAFLLREPTLSNQQRVQIGHDTAVFITHRESIANMVMHLVQNQQVTLFLEKTALLAPEQKTRILLILSKAFASQRACDKPTDLTAVLNQLSALEEPNLTRLSVLYETTPISINSLHNGLNHLGQEESFDALLLTIEKSPFGKRNWDAQFELSQVERVINESTDLINGTTYPYAYRKQLMEMFLLINAMGKKLPVFDGKAACDLTNQEIKTRFLKLKKEGQCHHNIKHQVQALTLMREAMYRSTGQFPNATQMIVQIDSLLHQGHVITNFDTGQGKSLVEWMECAFLWLISDRVERFTSSLIDAQRDIENYGAFLTALGIPFAQTPLSAVSPLAAYSHDGINFSTASQIDFFYTKAMLADHQLEDSDAIVSTVINESDFFILDDQTAYRFATHGANLNASHTWIYGVINSYIDKPPFTDCNTSKSTDLSRLRNYIRQQARLLDKSARILTRLDDGVLLKWLESALLVRYVLKVNNNFVISEHNVIQLLMEDKKVNPVAVFGNGLQQLLQDRLKIEITPETKTIISKANRNVLDRCLARTGRIWGSSGTVGSEEEIQEQFEKYGFAFSKIEPHHKKHTNTLSLKLLPNKKAHWAHLMDQVSLRFKDKNRAPLLIFCKSIDEVNALYAFLHAKFPEETLQYFTGKEEETAVIKAAATPGMVTITTAAIGRNTDVPYNKKEGMDVCLTFVSSTRLERQMSGRTNRQGSKGEIFYILNQEDQQVSNEAQKQQLQKKLDEIARTRREFNEGFYRLIGPLLTHVEQLPKEDFVTITKQQLFNTKWSAFSESQESTYREAKLANTYNEATFIQQMKEALAEHLTEAIPSYRLDEMPNLTTPYHPLPEKYASLDKPVLINECIPPIVIAHELFYETRANNNPVTAKDKKELFSVLRTLFHDAKANNFIEKNHAFLSYLAQKQFNETELKAIYRTFLQDELLPKIKKTAFMPRWLGYADKLTQLTNNQSYLFLFQALVSVDKDKPGDLTLLKNMTATIIQEYLENSWFISTTKRKAAKALVSAITHAKDDSTLIAALVSAQLTIADNDLALNKSLFFQTNRSGKSRLQHSITTALTLAASLSMQTDTHVLVDGLVNRLQSLSPKNAPLKTLDEVKFFTAHSMKGHDKVNAKVLGTALEKALEIGHRLR